MGNGEIVAEGEVYSKDPDTKLHHVPLGRHFWQVSVENIVVSGVPLCRAMDEFQVMDDVLNSFVAWPSKFIA